MSSKSETSRIFSLCAPPRCHCPKALVDIDTQEVTVFDDHGSSVKMPLKDLQELVAGLEEIC